MKGWIIKAPDGTICEETFRRLKQDSIDKFMEGDTVPFKYWYDRGFKVVECELKIVKKGTKN